MADSPTAHLRWRCVACRSENHVPAGHAETAPRELGMPVESACAHCRTRHILVGDPNDLSRVAPRDEIGRRGGGALARVLLAVGLVGVGSLGLYVAALIAAQGAEGASVWTALGLVTLVAGALLLLARRNSEAFLALEKGLEVRGADGRSRGLVPWSKVCGAEYRLLLGRRMALWLAVEDHDGSVPAAPLVAETGVALFTRSRAMPQFLMALAGRLGDRVRFVLPVMALGVAGGRQAVALRSDLAHGLASGKLGGAELAERLRASAEDRTGSSRVSTT